MSKSENDLNIITKAYGASRIFWKLSNSRHMLGTAFSYHSGVSKFTYGKPIIHTKLEADLWGSADLL